ncbi:MAG: ELWxxDGT repeat protein [Campylobacterales bacterium]
MRQGVLMGLMTALALVLSACGGGGSGGGDNLDSAGDNVSNQPRQLFFSAYDANGSELWVSDGTEAGTRMVKDINPGSASSAPYVLAAIGETIYFTADDGTHSRELWKSDGTEAGTVMVKDTCSNNCESYLSSPLAFNNKLYFSAFDGIHGRELWVSDGTAEGTKMVKNINTTTGCEGECGSNPDDLTVANGVLYFTAITGLATKRELWKSDGTEAGTVMVKDIHPGGESYPDYLRAYNNKLYFSAYHPDSGTELWKTDGTEAGTVLVKDIYPGTAESYPSYMTVFNNRLYFVAWTTTGSGELWKSDGTEAGTVLVKDGFTQDIDQLAVVGNTLYLKVDKTLWKTDGTTAGTVVVKEIVSAAPDNLTAVNNRFLFSADYKLWVSDGTEAGTQELWTNPSPGPYPEVKGVAGGALLFIGPDGGSSSLWKSDGTAAGTLKVKDIAPLK